MRHPLENVVISQYFGNKLFIDGVNVYKKWGLNGHNGIDYIAKNGTPVFAPHDGIVKKRRYDEGGYGYYLKIENDKGGSVLAHLESFNVNINQHVKEGDLVGYSNNSGFSTGPHLHWGYHPLPRDRNNGYNGYIDQLSLVEEDQDDMPKWLITMYQEVGIDITKPENVIRSQVQEVFDAYKKSKEQDKRIEELEKRAEGFAGEAAENEERLLQIEKSRRRLEEEVTDLKKILSNKNSEIERLTDEVDRLVKLMIDSTEEEPPSEDDTKQNWFSRFIRWVLRR